MAQVITPLLFVPPRANRKSRRKGPCPAWEPEPRAEDRTQQTAGMWGAATCPVQTSSSSHAPSSRLLCPHRLPPGLTVGEAAVSGAGGTEEGLLLPPGHIGLTGTASPHLREEIALRASRPLWTATDIPPWDEGATRVGQGAGLGRPGTGRQEPSPQN